jgi:ATP-dependent Clp protease ATP-binding subunit ClpX
MGYRRREGQLDRRCAFCGRPREEVRKLVAGPGVFICDRCIAVCRQLLAEDRMRTPPRPAGSAGTRLRPKDLAARLDEWVVGQERAKRMLAVAVYNHLKRVAMRGRPTDVELTKGNILLIGPPGTGKTHLARTLARILDVPFAMADATPLTQAGYVGEDVESIVAKLLRAADGNPERAATGIIYLDEVDKIARRVGHDRDVSGEGVQQGLLKILEGKRVQVRVGGDRTGLGAELVEVDTSDILFIGGGAFDGMVKSIAARKRAGAGFRDGGFPAATLDDGLRAVNPTDLHAFGFLPEFVGRFPVIVALTPADESMLVEILTNPRDALLRQYQRLFAMEGTRLEATSDGLLAIARGAMARGTGARALRAVMEELLLDVMFDLPGMHGAVFRLDEESVAAGRPRRTADRTAA